MEFPWLFKNDFVILQRQTIKQQFKKVEATPQQFSPKEMKNYHVIGQSFNLTYADDVKVRLVAREAETIHDKQFNEDFRKTCKGCYFCKIKVGYCSGHPYFEEVCAEGGCKSAKCSPEYREDGKWIHYKRIVTK